MLEQERAIDLKSSMDRFIEKSNSVELLQMLNLKSSMDRFIANAKSVFACWLII